MATFVLIPGAGCDTWYWSFLADELIRRGHDPVPVNLPCDDDTAGFEEYAATVVEAARGRSDIVLVAHSLAGFTAPLVCECMPVRLLVLLTAMIPQPGESAGDWWANNGYPDVDGDFEALFYNDVSSEIAAESERHSREQSATPMMAPWPLPAWPDVPTRFLLCRDDHIFPAEFMRRVVRDRLSVVPDEMPGGHMVMLSRPAELADRLVAYLG
jgi:pimeloyl-ACP methyl ester carboxylesterase